MTIQLRKILITLFLLALAAISPNLFPAAQAGLATFPSLIKLFFFPSAGLLLIVVIGLSKSKYNDISRLALNGMLAGLVATIALEVFREGGFKLGWMPGDLPRLMGVIMLDQFATGPDITSDLAGWAYHFWNGAMFGLIFSLLIGKSKPWQGVVYGLLIGIGFMVSPVVKSLGIGLFGFSFKEGYQFITTVTIAHLVFGVSLSFLLARWNKNFLNIIVRPKANTIKTPETSRFNHTHAV